VALVTWEQDSFAYADSYDEASGRYRGLRVWQHVPITDNDAGLLVRPGAARRQIEAEMQAQPPDERPSERGGEQPGKSGRAATSVAPPAAPKFKRFHGAVVLDPERVGRDASRIADEVVSHLKGLDGAKVKVTLEIEAEMPEGAPDNVVRNVNENSRTLKFTGYEFEPEEQHGRRLDPLRHVARYSAEAGNQVEDVTCQSWSRSQEVEPERSNGRSSTMKVIFKPTSPTTQNAYHWNKLTRTSSYSLPFASFRPNPVRWTLSGSTATATSISSRQSCTGIPISVA